jgi:carbon monoxide dehydrogenase subunit G
MVILYWILGILGGLVLLGVTLHLIGTRLPAGHVIGRSLRVDQTPEAVWQVIRDFAAVPTWHPHVKKAERLPDENGLEVWQEHHKGSGAPMRLETRESTPPTRLVRAIDDGQQFFRGRWEFDLVPDGAGSRLTITEHGEILKPIARSMARLFFNPATYIDLYLKALARKFNQEPAIQSADSSTTSTRA